jgi:sensor histidine kinase YesM
MFVLAASSAAPFIRFERHGPTLGLGDLGDAALYIAMWAPLIAVLVACARTATKSVRNPAAVWVGHVALFLVLPSLHTMAFLSVKDVLRGQPLTNAFGSVQFYILALLATLQYLVIVAVLLAARSGAIVEHERVRAAELELAGVRLEAQLTRARVAALRGQLQPHFLFNTLNSISVLVSADPAGARTMIRRLSDLLRAMLSDSDRPTVPLRREVELLNAYLAIQMVRFGERLRVRVDVDAAAAECLVPTLVLQPLVENAIQYAVAEREEGGCVTIVGRLEGERLVLGVVDDGAGCSNGTARTENEDEGRGVGHRNTRERLLAMYGASHAFVVDAAPGGGCEVRIELPA